MTPISNLEVLSWNCRSLCSNLGSFKLYLYNDRPHVACLVETWLKPEIEPVFINYTSYFCHSRVEYKICQERKNEKDSLNL